jgi:hypothetical protein
LSEEEEELGGFLVLEESSDMLLQKCSQISCCRRCKGGTQSTQEEGGHFGAGQEDILPFFFITKLNKIIRCIKMLEVSVCPSPSLLSSNLY